MPFEANITRPEAISVHPTRATLVALVDGVAQIRLRGGAQILEAESVVELTSGDIGEEVIVSFIDGQMHTPLVLGRTGQTNRHSGSPAPAPEPEPVTIEADGQRVQVCAKQTLTLRCGEASITLSADGRVVVKGRQILSQASGSHRIRGGTIKLN